MLFLMLASAIVAPSCTKEVAVASISLSASSVEIEVDESGSLTATVLPENATDKSIVWSSSNPENAHDLHLNFNGVYPQSFCFRCTGRFVRPVKDIN